MIQSVIRLGRVKDHRLDRSHWFCQHSLALSLRARGEDASLRAIVVVVDGGHAGPDAFRPSRLEATRGPRTPLALFESLAGLWAPFQPKRLSGGLQEARRRTSIAGTSPAASSILCPSKPSAPGVRRHAGVICSWFCEAFTNSPPRRCWCRVRRFDSEELGPTREIRVRYCCLSR